ncbi:hypothetical protein E3N88_22176 [Mikania micrantha]|uniref:PWI domain-containing protein n=1 Tax=Mikania micrantha TaxID=192012 RepID=A0A5N6NC91_9ASTR|nr:hypothetical protein E3N88_22176 [Mikania micrantha]
MSGGFFRGTTADQDTRFSNKHAKLLKSQKFPPELENLVDMTKVKMDVMRPWIAQRVTELLGFEDEVLINFIYGLLEEKVVNGKEIQISLTGFMEKNTGKFMKELWTHLLSAQQNASGVPQQFLDAKEEETRKKQEDTDRITRELKKTKEKEGHEQERVKMDRDADDVNAAILEVHPRRHTKFSSKWSADAEVTDERNGSKENARITRSPHSTDHILSPPRGTRSRSISRSSNSRSHLRSRSLSASPKPLRRSVSVEKRPHSLSRRSSTPRRVGARLRSPSPASSRGRSPSPARRRLRSPSPPSSRGRSSSPARRRLRSPARRRSRSPVWRRSRSPVRRGSRSPLRRRSRSPVRQRPRSPVRQRPRSPIHHRSRTPIRRRSRTPIRRRSRTPIRRRSRSPIRRRSMSRSPIQRRSMSRSPIRRRSMSRSPIRRRSMSRSPIRRRLRTPIRRRSRSWSPVQRMSQSPIRRRSPIPSHRRPRSPYQRRSNSTSSSSLVRSRSPSPVRGKPPSHPTRRQYQRAPSTPRDQSLSPTRRRTTFPGRRRSPNPRSRSSSPSAGISMPHTHGTPSSLLKRESPKHQQRSPIQSSQDRRRGHQATRKVTAESHSPAPVKSLESDPKGRRISHNKESVLSPTIYKSPLSSASPLDAGRSPRSKSPVPPKRQREGTTTKDRFDNVEDEEMTFSRVKADICENRDPVSHKRDKNKQSLPVEKRNSKNDGMSKADEMNQEAVKLPKFLPKEERHNQRGSLDSVSEKSNHKRKHKRKDVTSGDENSHDSHTEDRKEAKRRRKEAKKLKKEEKRKRREERRLKKDARRAERLKLKARGNVSPSSDSDKSYDTHDELASSDQKKLEIELREKALESLRAKKGAVY